MSFLSRLTRTQLAWGCLIMAALILLSVNILSETALRRSTFDLTDESLYTLTDGTREVLKGIDEPIKVRLYFSSALGERAPTFKRYFERVRTILERYADISGGKVQLEVFDPEPFSDAEDRAVAAGIQGIPLGNDGVNVYFGIYATNSTDNEVLMPIVALERERFLEYDLTKMIYSLAHPEKNVVGLMSALPVAGGQTPQGQVLPEWQVLKQIKEVFEVKPLVPNLEEVPEDVNLLMIVQPIGLTDKALYAIDQFVMKGGKALVFVDPKSDVAARQLAGMKGGRQDKGFERLLTAWGVELAENRILGDLENARKVQFGTSAQPVVVPYVAWLALGKTNLDADDVVSGGIERMHIASSGILDPVEGAETAFTPLLVSGPKAMRIDTAQFTVQPNPVKLLEDYKPGDKALTLAARVTGK
ncbi:MAG: GldG family protein, partial [Hyphomicrobiales bacterium]